MLQNQLICVSVVADKGADIYEFLQKPTDTEFLLRTPRNRHRQSPFLPHNIFAARKVFHPDPKSGLRCFRISGGTEPPTIWRSNLTLSPTHLERAIEQRHILKLDPAAELSAELKASISQAGK